MVISPKAVQMDTMDTIGEKVSIDDLIEIFHIQKKSRLKVHCRSAVIEQSDFANLVWLAMREDLPWLHRRHHRHFHPPHLTLSEEDLEAIATNGVGKFEPRTQKAANKLFATFEERRLLSGHLFYTPDHSNWHLFYFDQRDTARYSNHWEGGSHVHFINHLWTGRTAQGTWAEFCTGNPQMNGAIHIRYRRSEDIGDGRDPFGAL